MSYVLHGLSKSKLYPVWYSMVTRCTDRSYSGFENYGGRGISLCDDWYDLTKFYTWAIANGYSYDLQLDRIDNNGNYEPSNCRFVSRRVNNNNQRRRTSTLGYTGVASKGSNYRAHVSVMYRSIHIGMFPTIKEAVEARNQYIRDNNLPNRTQDYVTKHG